MIVCPSPETNPMTAPLLPSAPCEVVVRPRRRARGPLLGMFGVVGLGAIVIGSRGGDPPPIVVAPRVVIRTIAEGPLIEGSEAISPEKSGKTGLVRLVSDGGSEILEDERLIAEARRLIGVSSSRYASLRDYTCKFFKRERAGDGGLSDPHVLAMKVLTRPRSIYFKFLSPSPGREAIWADGRNDGKALVHDVGLGRLLAGTLRLDPLSPMAMEGCRHPITEAGLGPMIAQINDRWAVEMVPGETVVAIESGALIEGRPCTLIESRHTRRDPDHLFHMVKVYIDDEHELPIRFEGYDWPLASGGPAVLMEEYTFDDLRLDVGLTDADFDPENREYHFGRF